GSSLKSNDGAESRRAGDYCRNPRDVGTPCRATSRAPGTGLGKRRRAGDAVRLAPAPGWRKGFGSAPDAAPSAFGRAPGSGRGRPHQRRHLWRRRRRELRLTPYLTLMFLSCSRVSNIATSSWISFDISAGVVVEIFKPTLANSSITCGWFMALAISWLSSSTTAAGVPPGAAAAN